MVKKSNFLICCLVFLFTNTELRGAATVYAADFTNDRIYVIDADTNLVIATISDPEGPFDLAIQPNHNSLYAANALPQSASEIEIDTNVIIATIPISAKYALGASIAINPSGDKAYYTAFDGEVVDVLDLDTNTVSDTVTFTGASNVFFSAFSPDGTKAYVTAFIPPEGIVAVFDPSTDTVIATITLPPVAGVIFSEDSQKAYVSEGSDPGAVYVINTSTNLVVSTITVGAAPQNFTLSPDGLSLYLPNLSGGNVSVIHTVSDSVIATITVSSAPTHAEYLPDGTAVYVSDGTNSVITVIDPITQKVASTIPITGAPFALATFGDPPAPPPPPSSGFLFVSAAAKTNTFLTQQELFNQINWNDPRIATITNYRIYRDAAHTDLIGTVPAEAPLEFKDHNRMPDTEYSYFVVGVDVNGLELVESSGIVTTP